METIEVREGLEGVVAARTRLSDVDGERGRLIIAGHDVEQLAGKVSFEAVCGLLWDGSVPTTDRQAELQRSLGGARAAAFAQLDGLGTALDRPDAMDALRASLAQLRAAEPTDILGAVAVFAAAWWRRQSGLAPVPPRPELGHAADFLRMTRGSLPSPAEAEALEAYLVTVSDHGMNASTFAARVVTSTGSDRVSAIVAAVGALKGPLHGGAPGPVLDMLDAIGTPQAAPDWVAAELAAGRRLMGMGHRIYRVRDPRAAVLERAIERLEAAEVAPGKLALARAVEAACEAALAKRRPDRPLKANVEFYTAVLLDALGLDRRLFTATFAVGRTAGWLAHDAEQRALGRLIRPASHYVGPRPPLVQAWKTPGCSPSR